ncbi:MAG: quinone-dependent dihydroorotate dehydrogenase [Ferruginibacter sp.]
MYSIIREVLFLFNAERVHYFSMNALQRLCRFATLNNFLRLKFAAGYTQPKTICGLTFKNPVGLGAGFDKNAKYLSELETLGFGFVEIGTVTPLAQSGNSKPRLFRLPKDKGLINRMGFNNEGALIIADRLKKWREKNTSTTFIIGGNIGKNKQTGNEDAWKDYETCFNYLHSFVDYFVVNVSSPNTPGLRELQEKESLKKILVNLQEQNKKYSNPRPLFLKIAPDLTIIQINEVVELVSEINLDGLIIANTTISREGLLTPKELVDKIGAGGLSGKPLTHKAAELVKYITGTAASPINIIASGGIFTATDARECLDAGASLVQVWTGFIYEGPSIVKNICKGL